METLISAGKISLGKNICSGAFGTIFEGIWFDGVKQKLAIKTEHISSGNHLQHEFTILQQL